MRYVGGEGGIGRNSGAVAPGGPPGSRIANSRTRAKCTRFPEDWSDDGFLVQWRVGCHDEPLHCELCDAYWGSPLTNRSACCVSSRSLICSLIHCGFLASCLATQSGCALIRRWTHSG